MHDKPRYPQSPGPAFASDEPREQEPLSLVVEMLQKECAAAAMTAGILSDTVFGPEPAKIGESGPNHSCIYARLQECLRTVLGINANLTHMSERIGSQGSTGRSRD